MNSNSFERLASGKKSAIDQAQVELDAKQLECLDKINMYDALGASTLSHEELFDWFMARKTNEAINISRYRGFANIDYVDFEDIPTARNQLESFWSAQALVSLEPRRRSRKMLGRQAVSSALEASMFCKTIMIGNPAIEMYEYEMDADNYVARNSDMNLRSVASFIQEWDQFLIEQCQPPEDI